MRFGVTCSIRIKSSAARELKHIPQRDRLRIVQAIDSLGQQPFRGTVLKGGLRGLRRIRVGDYRVVYELLDEELVILVIRIAHRREAYRRC